MAVEDRSLRRRFSGAADSRRGLSVLPGGPTSVEDEDERGFPTTPGSSQELFGDVFESTGNFADFVSENNQRFTDVDLARVDAGRSLGLLDTVESGFLEAASGRDPVIEAQRQRSLAESSESFARRGTGGSSAAANEAARMGGLFDERQVAGRNAALSQLSQVAGQRFGIQAGEAGFNNQATGQELDFLQQAFENAELEPALLLDILNVASSGEEDDFNFFPGQREEQADERRRRRRERTRQEDEDAGG